MVIKESLRALTNSILILKKGGVVICPTDTVYGFLADASKKKAVAEIFRLKNRPSSKYLPVFVRDLAMASEVAFINEEQRNRLKKFWPGKYTFVLKRKNQRRFYGVAEHTLAIRVPKYKFLNNLLKEIEKPLVQTSVTISGEKLLSKIKDILEKFGTYRGILIIAGVNLTKSKRSKLIDLSNSKINFLR